MRLMGTGRLSIIAQIIGSMPQPLKQIVHSAVGGATYGVIVGALLWGVMLKARSSDGCGETFLRRERPTSAPTGDQAMTRPRCQLGVLAGATVYLVEADVAGIGGPTGYSLILAAWILLVVTFGFDRVRIPTRALTFGCGQLPHR